MLDGLLKVQLPLPWDVERREQVRDEPKEDGVVVRHNLGQVEVPQGSHQHLVLGTLGVASLQGAGDHQDGLDGAEAPVIVVLRASKKLSNLSK